MSETKLHIHSIIVHAVVAFGPLSAAALVLKTCLAGSSGALPLTFDILEKLGVAVIFLVSLPSLVTGVLDRNKMYAVWSSTHRMKMAFSVFLILATLAEASAWFFPGISKAPLSAYGLAVMGLNNLLIFLLAALGLKITLGRQSLEKTSYTPDLFNKVKKVDILDLVREHVREKPKIVDFQ